MRRRDFFVDFFARYLHWAKNWMRHERRKIRIGALQLHAKLVVINGFCAKLCPEIFAGRLFLLLISRFADRSTLLIDGFRFRVRRSDQTNGQSSADDVVEQLTVRGEVSEFQSALPRTHEIHRGYRFAAGPARILA